MGVLGNRGLRTGLRRIVFFRTSYKMKGQLVAGGGRDSLKAELLPGTGASALSLFILLWLPTRSSLKKHPCNNVNQQAREEEKSRGPRGAAGVGPAGPVASWQFAAVLS